MSEQSVYRALWNLPYPEETEHVVNAVGIKILLHVLESLHPPLAVVLNYGIPVVGRESPVLSLYRESVWRSPRLSVEVEIVRLLPYIAAVSVYANRDVALENDVLRACILMRFLHLSGEDELHVVVEGSLLVFL